MMTTEETLSLLPGDGVRIPLPVMLSIIVSAYHNNMKTRENKQVFSHFPPNSNAINHFCCLYATYDVDVSIEFLPSSSS